MNDANFFNYGLSCVIRWEEGLEQNMSLTLNSDVLFYGTNENGFNLTEWYTIKAGSLISRKVGTWDRIDGLVIPEPNIWERRSNLNRVPMEICVAPNGSNTFLMKVSKPKETKMHALYELQIRKHQLFGHM